MKARTIPRGTFSLGGLLATALSLPLTTLALRAVARRMHIGAADASESDVLVFAAIFAGLPTFLSGGGAARLVAHRLVEHPAPTLLRGTIIGAVALGIAGPGLALLAAVPLGGLPERPATWWPIFAAGAGVGAITGTAIGFLSATRALRHRLAAAQAVADAGAEAAAQAADGEAPGAPAPSEEVEEAHAAREGPSVVEGAPPARTPSNAELVGDP